MRALGRTSENRRWLRWAPPHAEFVALPLSNYIHLHPYLPISLPTHLLTRAHSLRTCTHQPWVGSE